MKFDTLIQQNILIDTHAHLATEVLDKSLSRIIKKTKEANVQRIINIAVSLSDLELILRQSSQFSEQLLPTIGTDPEILVPKSEFYVGQQSDSEFADWLKNQQKELASILTKHDFTMLGECGIDKYWLNKQVRDGKLAQGEMDLSVSRQEQLLRMQCELAKVHNLTLSLHSRNAEAYCLNILKDYGVTAVFHSFTGGYKVAKQIIDQGHFLGVNGIITYETAHDLRNLYQKLLGRAEHPDPKWFYDHKVVFETDAPWLKPFNSKELNDPSQITVIYKAMQELLRAA